MNPTSSSQHTDAGDGIRIGMEKLLQLQQSMRSTNTTLIDKGQIVITMNGLQGITSFEISEKLLLTGQKQIIRDRVLQLINKAIFTTSLLGTEMIKKALSSRELEGLAENTGQEISKKVELWKEELFTTRQKVASMTKTVASHSGNLSVVISGGRILHSLSVREESLTPQKKRLFETELVETVNRALREIQDDTQILVGEIASEKQ